MNLPDRHLLLGMTLGAVCATAIAAIGPGISIEVFADESAPGFDPSKLVKYEERDYSVDYDASVSTEPVSTSRIRKVEAGQVSYVTITTTASGTYSSDALFSRHVQYPGISVTPQGLGANRFAYWSGGKWAGFISRGANSFVYASRWRK